MAVTTAAVIGIAATAGTTAASFAQARKQRRLQLDAEAKAQEMMQEAQKKLEVNYYDQLDIQKEPYQLEREALISAGAQAIEAGKESERGAAAVAGRVQAAQVAGQREVAAAMGQEMLGLEKLSAQEESRLRDIQTQIDIDRARGAQLAAAQANEAANIANQQGIQGVISLGQQVAAAMPLYAKTGSPSATPPPAAETPASMAPAFQPKKIELTPPEFKGFQNKLAPSSTFKSPVPDVSIKPPNADMIGNYEAMKKSMIDTGIIDASSYPEQIPSAPVKSGIPFQVMPPAYSGPAENIFAATSPSIAATPISGTRTVSRMAPGTLRPPAQLFEYTSPAAIPNVKPTYNQWYGMNAVRLQGLSQKALRDMYEFDMSKL